MGPLSAEQIATFKREGEQPAPAPPSARFALRTNLFVSWHCASSALLGSLTCLRLSHAGYLVLHDVLDPSLMHMAREAVWDEIQQGIDRNDPETWVGPGSSGFRSGVDAGDKPWLLEMLPANPTVSGIAEQLLGKDQVVPLGSAIRGINVNLPFGSDRTEQGIRIESVHKRPKQYVRCCL